MTKLGSVQLKILRALWRLQRATARQLTDEMNKQEPIAHSTVQTLLRQLETKGAIGHEKEDRTFVFYPIAKESNVKQSATKDLVQNVFGGKVGGLVSYLLENEKISAAELKQIKSLLNKKDKQ